MKIYDCFSYWDEDLLLDLRLNILNDFIDYFVIVEGNKTWQNNFKKLRFDINKLSKFKDKIIYIPVEDMPEGDNPYLRENHQRNCINRGLKNALENDLIIISDLDEIPNPQALKNFSPSMRYAVFKQKHFYYKINLQSQKNPYWHGSRICVKKFLKSPEWLRSTKNKKYPVWRPDILFSKKKYNNIYFVMDGGWHFTNIRKPEDLEKKLSNFLHHVDFEQSKLELKDLKKFIRFIYKFKS